MNLGLFLPILWEPSSYQRMQLLLVVFVEYWWGWPLIAVSILLPLSTLLSSAFLLSPAILMCLALLPCLATLILLPGAPPGKTPIMAACCRRRLLFFKIEVRPRSCRSYHIWRPWSPMGWALLLGLAFLLNSSNSYTCFIIIICKIKYFDYSDYVSRMDNGQTFLKFLVFRYILWYENWYANSYEN